MMGRQYGRVVSLTLTVLAAFFAGTVPAAAQPPDVTVEYYHLDAVGSVRAVTNASGVVVARYDYRPFGEGDGVSAGADPMRFTGKERDAETGLDYLGARYYASRSGRFTTVDPGHVGGNIFDPQSWNAYAYARNNPLRFVDPTGTEYIVCASGGSCNSVGDYEWESALENLGGNFTVQGNKLLAWTDGRWQLGAYFYWQPDRPRDFNGMVRDAGNLAAERLQEELTRMAIGSATQGLLGLAKGALSGGLAVNEVLGIGRIARSTLEATFGPARAAVVSSVLKGRQPLSALTAEERALAAAFYRAVSLRTQGKYAADAARYNIARAEFFEGTRSVLSPTLPQFIRNGF